MASVGWLLALGVAREDRDDRDYKSRIFRDEGASRPGRVLPRPRCSRCTLRWRLLRRRENDRGLLPAGVSGTNAAARALRLLLASGAGRARWLPRLLSLSS